jgi:hypothetical protein
MAYFKVLSLHLCRGPEEKKKSLRQNSQVSQLRFDQAPL